MVIGYIPEMIINANNVASLPIATIIRSSVADIVQFYSPVSCRFRYIRRLLNVVKIQLIGTFILSRTCSNLTTVLQ